MQVYLCEWANEKMDALGTKSGMMKGGIPGLPKIKKIQEKLQGITFPLKWNGAEKQGHLNGCIRKGKAGKLTKGKLLKCWDCAYRSCPHQCKSFSNLMKFVENGLKFEKLPKNGGPKTPWGKFLIEYRRSDAFIKDSKLAKSRLGEMSYSKMHGKTLSPGKHKYVLFNNDKIVKMKNRVKNSGMNQCGQTHEEVAEEFHFGLMSMMKASTTTEDI